MMKFYYNLSIYLLQTAYWLAAFFHIKANQFVTGRRNIFLKLKDSFIENTSPVVWVHCASLGEFEQGRPLMELLKKAYPANKVLLTFFSPSGYEVRKNYHGADFIFYLPFDTPSYARRFIEITKPVLAIFIKYEFWYNYSAELKKRNTPLLSVSCIFRPEQFFFKPYGTLFRKILDNFNWFFVQNQESIKLLKSIGITNASVAGEPPVDRVYQITQQGQDIPIALKFKNSQKVVVIGNPWPQNIDTLAAFIK